MRIEPVNFYNEIDPKAAAWLRQLIADGLIPPGDVDERSITEIKPHELSRYTQCHFFAGIGGWSLALHLAGWPATRPVGTGSCPCQPFSCAGKQLGKDDERHLWPVFFSLIRACRDLGQPWAFTVMGEQVASAAGLGWLDGVSADLEGAGYTVWASDLCAASVGAPHIRQRLFWLADATSRGQRIYGSTPGRPGHADERGEADGWKRVVFSGDTDEDGNCPVCGIDYADCGCPGPTQDDEYKYYERDGVLYARRLDHPERTRLERHAGHEHDGNKPGRDGAQPLRPTAEAGDSSRLPDASSDMGGSGQHLAERGQEGRVAYRGADAWSRFDPIPCADGKTRRIESGTLPLVDGLPRGVVPSCDPGAPGYAENTSEARVMRLRGYGNAIVPQVAAAFVSGWLEIQRTAF